MSLLDKLRDLIYANRFTLWYTPPVEQGGSQVGRSCVEQILCVRLLIDFARYKKKKLYIVFVDFEKAYDKMNRQ